MIRWSASGYLLAVRNPGSGPAARHRDLPLDPSSARAARALVQSTCEDWAVDDDVCDDATLVASELVANVIDHARTQCRITVSVQDTGLRVDVRDFFPGPPLRPRPIDVHAQRGRGLQVVDALSAVWGVTEFDDGKSVWAVLASATPPGRTGLITPGQDHQR